MLHVHFLIDRFNQACQIGGTIASILQPSMPFTSLVHSYLKEQENGLNIAHSKTG